MLWGVGGWVAAKAGPLQLLYALCLPACCVCAPPVVPLPAVCVPDPCCVFPTCYCGCRAQKALESSLDELKLRELPKSATRQVDGLGWARERAWPRGVGGPLDSLEERKHGAGQGATRQGGWGGGRAVFPCCVAVLSLVWLAACSLPALVVICPVASCGRGTLLPSACAEGCADWRSLKALTWLLLLLLLSLLAARCAAPTWPSSARWRRCWSSNASWQPSRWAGGGAGRCEGAE